MSQLFSTFTSTSTSGLAAATATTPSSADGSARAVRLLTELDHIRISKLLTRPSSPLSAEAAEQIEDVLQNAELISSYDVPSSVVTMYSQVMIADMPSGQHRKLTICYPSDAEPSTSFVSVFSPVGTSLLGLTVGQVAQWTGPDGKPASAEILVVVFQPEESGDYLL